MVCVPGNLRDRERGANVANDTWRPAYSPESIEYRRAETRDDQYSPHRVSQTEHSAMSNPLIALLWACIILAMVTAGTIGATHG